MLRDELVGLTAAPPRIAPPRIALAVLAFARLTSSKVYLYEDFSGDWEDRWVVSDWKQDSGEAGRWEVSAGRFYADDEKSKGLRTVSYTHLTLPTIE